MDADTRFAEGRSLGPAQPPVSWSTWLRGSLPPLLVSCVVATPLLVPTLGGTGDGGGRVPGDVVNGAFIIASSLVLWRARPSFRLPLGASFLLLVLGGLIALPRSIDLHASVLAMLEDVYLFVWFLLMVNCVREGIGADSQRLSSWWIVTGVVVALLATLAALAYPNHVPVMFGWATVSAEGRAMATLRNPNLAGHYLVVSFFVLWAAPKPEKIPVKALLSVPVLVAIALTYSNSALVALLAGSAAAGAVALFARRPALAPVVVGLVGASMALAIWLAPLLLETSRPAEGLFGDGSFLARSVGRIDNSATYRTERWRMASFLFGGQILVGIGPDSADHTLRLLHAPVTGELHSDYIAGFVERGLLGGIGTMGLMVAAMAYALRANRSDHLRYRGWWPASLAGGVVAIALSAATLESLHFRHVWLFFALVVAVSTLGDRDSRVPDQPGLTARTAIESS